MKNLFFLFLVLSVSGCLVDDTSFNALEKRVTQNEGEIEGLKIKIQIIQCFATCKPKKAIFHLDRVFSKKKACECQ